MARTKVAERFAVGMLRPPVSTTSSPPPPPPPTAPHPVEIFLDMATAVVDAVLSKSSAAEARRELRWLDETMARIFWAVRCEPSAARQSLAAFVTFCAEVDDAYLASLDTRFQQLAAYVKRYTSLRDRLAAVTAVV
jgi:glutathione S-transferase